MSYLHLPRIYFSGEFQADPSTVNNTPSNFDNATYRPGINDSWNPTGGAAWRFINCFVSAVQLEYGDVITDAARDGAVGLHFTTTDTRVAAKLVDLDSQQQAVSQIWGMVIRLTTNTGSPDALKGDYQVAAFSDLWQRANLPNDFRFSAYYQSVIANLAWGDISFSPALVALRQATQSGRVSIRFNVDRYHDDSSDPQFTVGRVAGVIGPYLDEEPVSLLLGRHLLQSVPNCPVMCFPCLVDAANNKVTADFGNSIPCNPDGSMEDIGTLTLVLQTPTPTVLGKVNYLDPGWYTTTGGLQEFDINAAAAASRILTLQQNGTTILQENSDASYLRADQFVYRLNPGESATVNLYATRFGQPVPSADITLQPTVGQLDNSEFPVNTPASALQVPYATTVTNGLATFTITASDPGSPRDYIDGQLYGIQPAFFPPGPGVQNTDPWDFISVLVWTETPVPDQPTWDDVYPILKQYANLYPLMSRIVRLDQFASVTANLIGLKAVFGLPVADPNYMPVTRDLSASKLKLLMKWFDNPLPGKSQS